jgi:hypothetical protein
MFEKGWVKAKCVCVGGGVGEKSGPRVYRVGVVQRTGRKKTTVDTAQKDLIHNGRLQATGGASNYVCGRHPNDEPTRLCTFYFNSCTDEIAKLAWILFQEPSEQFAGLIT